jgi:hypothetical protein
MIQLRAPPKALGLRKAHNKLDGKDTRMDFGIHLFAPLYWYLNTLQREMPSEHHGGTMNAELAIDFEASTGVPLARSGTTGERTLRERTTLFPAAAKRVAQLCGKQVPPGLQCQGCRALVVLKHMQIAGYECRARPKRPLQVGAVLARGRRGTPVSKGTPPEMLDFVPKWLLPRGKPDWVAPVERLAGPPPAK